LRIPPLVNGRRGALRDSLDRTLAVEVLQQVEQLLLG
jgi:hypothetical protein